MADRFIGNRKGDGLNCCGQLAHSGRRVFAPQLLNLCLIGGPRQRLCFLTLDDLLECILERVTEFNAAHGQQYIKAAVDKVKMKHLICGGFIWLQSCWQLMDADIILTLSHFKGHELTGFGGAIKNIGMGGGSRAGKMEMHCEGKPQVKTDACIGCGACQRICAHGAPIIDKGKVHIDEDLCVGCGRCIGACPVDAIHPTSWHSGELLNKKMAEYAAAILHGRPHFHISLIVDVSPFCDCHAENDVPIVPNIGMAASFDPVALDEACADLVNQAPVLASSLLAEQIEKDPAGTAQHDHFHNVSPNTDWTSCLAHSEKIGLGSRSYELIKI